MKVRNTVFAYGGSVLPVLLLATFGLFVTHAADHGDVPQSLAGVHHEANLTGLHAFRVETEDGHNLVLALSTNRAIPPEATSYVFPTDVTFEINIDVNATVIPDNESPDGGMILQPHKIKEEIIFRILFRDDGSVKLQRVVRGVVKDDPQVVNFFAGLRDDPFIRTPREGRNVAAIVLEVPLSSVVSGQSTLLIWATSKVKVFDGPFHDLAGRALRSQFPEQNALNRLHPKHHVRRASFTPDVIIYDTNSDAAFPNGRALEDDVVDLVCQLEGECRVFNMANEGLGGPSANDVPFLSTFPYSGEPQP